MLPADVNANFIVAQIEYQINKIPNWLVNWLDDCIFCIVNTRGMNVNYVYELILHNLAKQEWRVVDEWQASLKKEWRVVD